jgi:hypothetical protein
MSLLVKWAYIERCGQPVICLGSLVSVPEVMAKGIQAVGSVLPLVCFIAPVILPMSCLGLCFSLSC